MEEKLLEVRQIVKSYAHQNVVDGLSLEMHAGEIVGLIGPNGAGKTTAFYIIAGLIAADSGAVFLCGHDVTSLPIHRRASMGMGYLTQESSVFRTLTVEQNIRTILEILPISRRERNVRLEQLLEELHLTPLAKKRAFELSGGERRRLEITRALVTHPRCLLLDEPFANIDPLSVQEVKSLVRHLTSKGIGVLITDHNAREIFSLVDRSYLVCAGKVLSSGRVDELIDDPRVRQTYLGEQFTL